jgi:hypothetical protein
MQYSNETTNVLYMHMQRLKHQMHDAQPKQS